MQVTVQIICFIPLVYSFPQIADKNKDGSLDREEFAVFLHPEDNDHMKDVVISEAMEDMDKDKDGFVTLQEYIGK